MDYEIIKEMMKWGLWDYGDYKKNSDITLEAGYQSSGVVAGFVGQSSIIGVFNCCQSPACLQVSTYTNEKLQLRRGRSLATQDRSRQRGL